MGMMINRRRACGGKKGLLPSGYKQLEYIENTSNAYIDTGIKPNTTKTKAIGKFYITDTATGDQGLFGARTRIGNNVCNVFLSGQQIRYDWAIQSTIGITRVKRLFEIEISGGYLKIDDVILVDKTCASGNVNYNFLIFSFTNYDSYLWYVPAKGRLYYFQLYNEGTLIRNFIPCKNPQNVVGMYDTVNGRFYSSPNGTAFVAGPVVGGGKLRIIKSFFVTERRAA